jgi:hypothetical protein
VEALVFELLDTKCSVGAKLGRVQKAKGLELPEVLLSRLPAEGVRPPGIEEPLRGTDERVSRPIANVGPISDRGA